MQLKRVQNVHDGGRDMVRQFQPNVINLQLWQQILYHYWWYKRVIQFSKDLEINLAADLVTDLMTNSS